jgi:hypothetical protein
LRKKRARDASRKEAASRRPLPGAAVKPGQAKRFSRKNDTSFGRKRDKMTGSGRTDVVKSDVIKIDVIKIDEIATRQTGPRRIEIRNI